MTNYRRRRAKPKPTGQIFKINQQIKADQVRILDEENQMLGIFDFKTAQDMADEQGFDLIEINPKSDPPIIRMMAYSKFKYQQSKSQTPKKTGNEMKTVRVSVRVSPHDLVVRAKQIDKFLEKGLKVKMQVQMRGREKQHPEVAVETMDSFVGMLSEGYAFESEPKQLGDSVYTTIKPK
jgi:translation initiation factor IF-3